MMELVGGRELWLSILCLERTCTAESYVCNIHVAYLPECPGYIPKRERERD
jgi:hypothetical protein